MRSGGARVPTRADPGSVTRRRHRNGFCHPDRDSPTQSRPAGRELRAERRTHLAGCPGQGPGGEQPPGRLCPGAAAGAAPRSPVSGCSLRRRASRRPPLAFLSPVSPSGTPRCLFTHGAPPEPRAAGTGQRRLRAGGAGAAAPSAWEERAAAGAERRRGEGRI